MFFISKDGLQLDSTLGFFFIISDISPIASIASFKENQDWLVTFKKEGKATKAITITNKQKRQQLKPSLQVIMSELFMKAKL